METLAAVGHIAFVWWLWFWANVLDTDFASALFGAGFGALAAYFIAARSERRNRLRDGIAGINSAIALANTITNTFVAVKRQHVMAMMNFYRAGFDAWVAFILKPTGSVFTFVVDNQTLPMPITAIEELRETLLDRVQSCGAALSIAVPLHQSIAALTQVLEARNQTLAHIRSLPGEPGLCAYYGLRMPDGSFDQRYSDSLLAIALFVDDGIYFPMLLCDVLVAHGKQLARAYGRNAPKISTVSFQRDPIPGLMPDPENYPDFEKGYRAKLAEAAQTKSRLDAFRHWLARIIDPNP